MTWWHWYFIQRMNCYMWHYTAGLSRKAWQTNWLRYVLSYYLYIVEWNHNSPTDSVSLHWRVSQADCCHSGIACTCTIISSWTPQHAALYHAWMSAWASIHVWVRLRACIDFIIVCAAVTKFKSMKVNSELTFHEKYPPYGTGMLIIIRVWCLLSFHCHMVRIHIKMASSPQATFPERKDAAALCTKVLVDSAKIIYLRLFYIPYFPAIKHMCLYLHRRKPALNSEVRLIARCT